MLNRIIVLVVLLPTFLFAQHTIKGIFSPAKDYNVALLYKAMPTISEYITNAEIKEDGSFQFQLDSTAAKGMYKLVYAVPQEDYNFDIIYNGKEDIVLTFNSETGVKFTSSSENKLLASYTNSMSMVTQSIGNYYRQQSKDTTALKAIFKTQRDTQLSFEKAAKGTIALQFIKANKPYIPKKYENVKTYIKNLEAHYFDYVDFNNITLQSSSFLEERMLNYVFGMTSETLDEEANYKKNIDVFYGAMKTAPNKIKRILLLDLWQQLADLGNESVANYISETYLIDVALALNDQQLVKDLLLFKRVSLGEKAPDFSIEIEKDNKKITKNLSALNTAENYIVLFWNSTCSHCLDEVPRLDAFVKSQDKGKTQVIAIGLEDNDKLWKNRILKLPNFIHVLGLGKWENDIGNDYGVTATPTYFILDKEKHIIAKPEDLEAVKAFFEE
ncbi:TlpA family protein disulfide reductase [Thalassobellus suaedae]|uniref:TlpA disulfide reductase family protein n=1 Tax=Thalassobellus suaedae TaxID=3074124 RepID=A0ABY9XS66_9FLAO|nr:TlpA disulfide reductase family protein [Flavobacteriaceae bacterium HL-DH14]WNH13878.1 TlpA disulfide reductase family protein [Flavobacteriaceae bacterium HL-DH10]